MIRGDSVLHACLLVLAVSSVSHAQSPTTAIADHFKLGREALAAHDPTTAIAQLEQVDTREAAEWLAVALMMESRAASDQFVERAFAAAQRARIAPPAQIHPRADAVAALRPGDMVIAFLVGEAHAYAWAFDADGFVGYQLPSPPEFTSTVDGARTYADQGDRDGLQRIAEDLVPTLLGPAAERLPQLKRVIFVLDGPLRRLPIGALPVGDAGTPLGQRVEVVTTEFNALVEAIGREQAGPIITNEGVPAYVWMIGSTLLVALLIGGVTLFKRR